MSGNPPEWKNVCEIQGKQRAMTLTSFCNISCTENGGKWARQPLYSFPCRSHILPPSQFQFQTASFFCPYHLFSCTSSHKFLFVFCLQLQWFPSEVAIRREISHLIQMWLLIRISHWNMRKTSLTKGLPKTQTTTASKKLCSEFSTFKELYFAADILTHHKIPSN